MVVTGLVTLRWRYFYKSMPAWSTKFGNHILYLSQDHPHVARILHVILDAVPDAVPLLLGLAGLAYLMPGLTKRIEESKPLRLGLAVLFILFAFFAIVVNSINREAEEHKSENQDARLGAVQFTNDQILKAVLNPSSDLSETARRRRIEEVLRNKYILAHKDISPEILAGTAFPPTDWMNQELENIHETWKFSTDVPNRPVVVQQVLPEPKKANVEFGFYTDALPENITKDLIVTEKDDSSVVVPLTFRVIGNVSAHGLHIWIRLCDQCLWKEEPEGSQPADVNKPKDREKFIGNFDPGPLYRAINLHIALPSPSINSFSIAAYFACDNCPPANPNTAQVFNVRVEHSILLGPPAPHFPPLGTQ
jgi:hypothetical protein